ncbi:hypothetical protein NKR23_g2348 [Pleurostoma richardsiae]|uniref:Uncharacterized protein n=1 Tax=Pleurostoma richardsiae TaxID=41990 RepID=A0AA38S2K1_9PEZI|nr:hypothetical protein NKR23_g2348 [Pleurostoma richardsiae]
MELESKAASESPSNNGAPLSVAPGQFDALKKWIAKQEAYEAATSQPAPLTDGQRKAMASLIRTRPEPAMGDDSWMQLLNRYRQAHPDDMGVIWTDGEFVSDEYEGGWTVGCRITEAPAGVTFPEQDEGGPLLFARKKDAKHYAAQCAVRWLMAQKLMPDNGRDVKFKDVPPSGDVDPLDDRFLARQRVPVVCHQLGFPAPRYQAVSDLEQPGLFDAYADFFSDSRINGSMFRVTGVRGENAAKEKVAELVLAHMLKLEEARKKEAAEIMGYEPQVKAEPVD